LEARQRQSGFVLLKSGVFVNNIFVAAFAARVSLSAVFSVSSVFKYRDRPEFRSALVEFGVPEDQLRATAILIPVLEAVAGLLLASGDPFHAGAILGLMLVGTFTVAVVAELVRGRRPHCACFGRMSSARINWTTVALNVVLIGLACVSIISPRNMVVQSGSIIGGVLLWTAFAGGSLFVFRGKVRPLGVGDEAAASKALWEAPNAERPLADGLPVGSTAPGFRLPALSGKMISLEDLCSEGAPVLLIFIDAHCRPCDRVLAALASLWPALSESFTVAIISEGNATGTREKFARYGIRDVICESGGAIGAEYMIHIAPSALLIGVAGEILSTVFSGVDAVAMLLREATQPEWRAANTHGVFERAGWEGIVR
jgi:peroxiredoxin